MRVMDRGKRQCVCKISYVVHLDIVIWYVAQKNFPLIHAKVLERSPFPFKRGTPIVRAVSPVGILVDDAERLGELVL
jgi:hypothetical protein